MVDVLKFSYADVIARANRTSVEAAADQWIHEAMDEDTAADYDYVTVFEEGAPEQEELVPAQPQVADLQQRVRELEVLVASQSPGMQTAATSSTPTKQGSALRGKSGFARRSSSDDGYLAPNGRRSSFEVGRS